jgi:hypothetical protein
MATPVTWSGLTSVSMASRVDSDPITLPPGTSGFSATVFAQGGAPSGITGNLQIAVSNGGPYVVLPGLLACSASNGLIVPFPFSYPNAFFNSALLRWTQAGPYDAGTLFDGDWSVTAIPVPPPTPGGGPVAPGAASFAVPQLGRTPASAAELTGYFNALFANRWVQPPGAVN